MQPKYQVPNRKRRKFVWQHQSTPNAQIDQKNEVCVKREKIRTTQNMII